MSILGWVILGGLAGWLASVLTSEPRRGCLTNIVLGVIGAVVGGLVFSFIGRAPVTGFNLWSLFVATSGAVIVIVLFRIGRREK